MIGLCALKAPRKGGPNVHPFISCSYRDCAHGRRCDDREESLQERLSLVVRSNLHRAAPPKNPAPYLILLAVAMTGWGRPVVVKGPDWRKPQIAVWPTLLRETRASARGIDLSDDGYLRG